MYGIINHPRKRRYTGSFNDITCCWRNVSEDCCDNSGNDGTTDGKTCFAVGATDVQNINFGITQPLSVGNLVWNDLDRDGVKDANETGIENAVVNLYRDENNDCLADGPAILQPQRMPMDCMYSPI
ncbi:MAG: hypothetical protein HWD58_11980 [Bacteroidota bacterium]|nr:MAG: hypothetical protein HWD58_11980 [Bacteroidota bacterium]